MKIRSAAVHAKKNGTYAIELGTKKKKVDQVVVDPIRTPEALELYGNMALVEWWILAQADWMITNGGSFYPLTASMIGLGPIGTRKSVCALITVVYFPVLFFSCDRWHGAIPRVSIRPTHTAP